MRPRRRAVARPGHHRRGAGRRPAPGRGPGRGRVRRPRRRGPRVRTRRRPRRRTDAAGRRRGPRAAHRGGRRHRAGRGRGPADDPGRREPARPRRASQRPVRRAAAGAAPLPAQLHLTAGIERVFLDRCRRLPPAVQTLLLVAAADDSGHVATVRAAAAQLGVGPDSLDAAERSGLLVVDGDVVRVRHPLVRSAVYQAATSRERHEAHRALAEALGPPRRPGPVRMAPGRSCRQPRPGRRRRPDRRRRARRTTRRVRRRLRRLRARRRADRRRAGPRAAPVRRRPHRLGRRAHHHGARAVRGGARARRRPGAARRHRPASRPHRGQHRVRDRRAPHLRRRRPGRPRRRTHPRARAGRRCRTAQHLRRRQRQHAWTPPALATAAIASQPPLVPRPGPAASATSCSPSPTPPNHDWAPALASLRAALDVGADVADLDLLSHLGNAALHLGDDEAHHRCFTAMAAGARDAGAGMLVLYALPRLGFTQLVTGRWRELRGSAEEALSLSASTGQPGSPPPRSAGSPSSPPSKADPPPSTTRCSPTSTKRPSSRSACSPTPSTTSPAGRKAPGPPRTATPGRHCTTSPASGSTPSAASPRSTASTPPCGPTTASRLLRG